MAGGTRAAGSEGVKEGRCWSPAATWGPPGSGLREWWSREVEIATRESGEAEEREREEERRERKRFWTRGKFQASCGGLRGKNGALVDGWDEGQVWDGRPRYYGLDAADPFSHAIHRCIWRTSFSVRWTDFQSSFPHGDYTPDGIPSPDGLITLVKQQHKFEKKALVTAVDCAIMVQDFIELIEYSY
jgi:hypothetical protein